MYISNGKQLILTGIKRNGLYVLNGQHVFSEKPISALTSNIDMTNSWHLRLGHIGQK